MRRESLNVPLERVGEMRISTVKRVLPVVLLGLVMLTVAGCFGGSRNFTSGAVASAQTASGAQSSGAPRPNVGIRVGNLAPDFTLKGLDGQTVRLSDFRGKAVLLNFWATWCPPCRQEMPDLEKAYQKYKDQGVVFLGIDMQEDQGTVKQFVQQNGYGWIFAVDSSGQVADTYQAAAIPTSYFIDRDGVIRDTQIGAIPPSLLEAKLAKIR